MKKKKQSFSVNKKQLQSSKIFLTPRGLEKLQSELEYLRKDKRSEVVERIRLAQEFGDVTENSEYDAAMDERAYIESRIAELEDTLRRAKLVKEEERSLEFVTIGSTVKVEIDNEIDEFTIVGRMEADPAKKKISNESPLGGAILGGKIGEEVEVSTPIVKYRCKILEIK